VCGVLSFDGSRSTILFPASRRAADVQGLSCDVTGLGTAFALSVQIGARLADLFGRPAVRDQAIALGTVAAPEPNLVMRGRVARSVQAGS